MVASVAAMLNLLKALWFDGELYKLHLWFHMFHILIMQLRGASFILRMKSRVLLRSEVGMIVVSICLHGVISWSQASGRGRFGPTKTVIVEKFHPSVLKFCLTWTVYNISNKMTKFYDDVYSFEPVRGCQFLKLYISMFESGWSHRNGCWRWANPKCACVWRQLGGRIRWTPDIFSLAVTALKPQQIPMFLYISARARGRRWSSHTSKQKGCI